VWPHDAGHAMAAYICCRELLLAEGGAAFLDGADPQYDSARHDSRPSDHESKADPVVRRKGTSRDELIADTARVDARQGDRCGQAGGRESEGEGQQHPLRHSSRIAA
jgi:hypothetical protein